MQPNGAGAEKTGLIAEDNEIMVIPCVNYYSMNIGKRFWAMDNTDINRMFPGYWQGETTQRIADGVFSKIQGYEYGIQLASFYQQGNFLPHVKMMDTGFASPELMKDFGLQFGIIRNEGFRTAIRHNPQAKTLRHYYSQLQLAGMGDKGVLSVCKCN